MTKTVLAVDDDGSVLEFYKIAFRRHSQAYELLITTNPLEAFSTIDKKAKTGSSIDLLITDLNMPELGGLDLIRNARAVSPQTKFMLCSGREESEINQLIARLRNEGIEVKYLPPSYLWDTDNLIGEVKSLIGE